MGISSVTPRYPVFLSLLLASFSLNAEVLIDDLVVSPEGPYSISVGYGQSTTLDLSVTNTNAIDGCNLNAFFEGLNPGLDGVLEQLNTNVDTVLETIPDRYFFRDGVTGYGISDGGGDMYDGGNYLRFDNDDVLYYSDNTISTANGVQYFTRKFDGLFVLGADYGTKSSFNISGNLGADGWGDVTLNEFSPGYGYRAFFKVVHGANDPSINQLILVPNDPGLQREASLETNYDDHTVLNLPENGRLFYLLFAEGSGQTFPQSEVESLARAFLSKAAATPSWFNFPFAPLPANSSTDLQIALDAYGLDAGTYTANFAIAPDSTQIESIPAGKFQELNLTVSEPSFTLETQGFNLSTISGISPDPLLLSLQSQSGGSLPGLTVSADDSSWLTPSVVSGQNVIQVNFDVAALSTGTHRNWLSITSESTTQIVQIELEISELDIVKLLADNMRPRLYALHQNEKQEGGLLIIDTQTQQYLDYITLGREPTDMDLTELSEELLVINTSDPSIQRIDLETLEITDSYALSEFSNRNDDFGGHVADGPGDVIYYVDEQWGPRLRVFDTSSETVLQTLSSTSGDSPDTTNNYGYGDVVVSSDRSRLYGWSQYGDGAGVASTYIVRFDVSENGLLSGFLKNEASYSETSFRRTPLDTPALLLADDSELVIKDRSIDIEDIDLFPAIYPDEIYSISPMAEVVSGNRAIYNPENSEVLFDFPVNANVQTILPDYSSLVYFNPSQGELTWLDLSNAVNASSEVLELENKPADNAVVFSPAMLEWQPLAGYGRYHVYLGTDLSAVSSATPTSSEYLGATMSPYFELQNQLELGNTYYWRVDGFSASGTSLGAVRSFSIAEINAAPQSISLKIPENAPTPDQTVQFSGSPGIAWSAQSTTSWIEVLTPSGTTETDLKLRLSTATLSAGKHSGVVQLSISGNTVDYPVEVNVLSGNIVKLESSPGSSMVYALLEIPKVEGPSFILEIDPDSTSNITRYLECGYDVVDFSISRDSEQAFVLNENGKEVSKFDLEAWTRGASIELTSTPNRIIAAPDGNFIINYNNDLHSIDSETGELLSRLYNLAYGYSKGWFSEDGTTLYIAGNTYYSKIAKVTYSNGLFSNLVEGASASRYASLITGAASGNRLFVGNKSYNFDLSANWYYDESILATDSQGVFCLGESELYWTDSGKLINRFDTSTTVVAVSGDNQHIVRYEADTNSLNVYSVSFFLPYPGPTPQPGQQLSQTPDQLSIAASESADEYRFYFGTSPDALSLLTSTTQPVADLDRELLPLRSYYWRVDVVDGSNVQTGSVYDFSILPTEIETGITDVDASVSIDQRDLLSGTADYSNYKMQINPFDPVSGEISEGVGHSREGSYSYSSVFGQDLVKAGGDYYTLDDSGIYKISLTDRGNPYQAEVLALPEEAAPRSLSASGDLLFVSVQAARYPSYNNKIYVYRTFPQLRLEDTISAPSSVNGSSVYSFGQSFSASASYLAIRGHLANTRSEAVLIYSRDHQNSTWNLDEVAPLQNEWGHAVNYSIDTDDHRIAVATNSSDGAQLSVLKRLESGSFSEETFYDYNDFSTNERGPVLVNVDQGHIALALPNADVAPTRGIIELLEFNDGQWELLNPIARIDGGIFANRISVSDGWLATIANEEVILYSLGDENIRPLITSARPFQLVAGRSFEIPITYDDPDDTSVSLSLMPDYNWVSILTTDQGSVLTGTPPTSLTGNTTLRIAASDSLGASDAQTFDIMLLSPDDVPVVESLPAEQTLGVGQKLHLKPEISGTGPFTWQWYKDGVAIDGANQDFFAISFVSFEDAATYSATITNAVDTTRTEEITVNVRPANRFAGDWPMFGGGPEHLGFYPATLETHHFIPVWSQEVSSNSLNRAVIAENKVFITPYVRFNGPDFAYCYDVGTGEIQWTHEFPQSSSLNPPAYHDGRLYIQRVKGIEDRTTQLWSIDALDGTTVWTGPHGAQWERYESPTVTDDGIWINGGRYGGMYGFDLDGTQRFFEGLPQVDGWTPTYSNGRLYSFVGGTFVEHNPESGDPLWSLYNGSNGSASIAAVTHAEALIVSSRDLICIDLEDRSIRWRVEKRFYGYPAVNRGNVYVTTQNQIETYDLETGSPGLVYLTGSSDNLISRQAVILNDFFFVASADATYIFEVGNTSPVQTLPTGGYLSYADGYLLSAGFDGTLTAYFANDVPDFISPPPDLTADEAGSDISVDISQYVYDDDVDDQLRYAIVNNTNTDLFSSISIGATNGVLDIVFNPYAFGSSDLTIRVTDQHDTYSEYTMVISLPRVRAPDVHFGPIEINRQSGLYEQIVTVTNNGPRAIGGFELAVLNLHNGYQIFGYSDGIVGYYSPIESGNSVDLILQYYSQESGEPPSPTFETTTVLQSGFDEAVTPGVPVDRVLKMDDGSIMIEFLSTPGHVYAIQYSYDMEIWYQSNFQVLSGANRTQWFDDGMPKTDRHPSEVRSKFYRVLDITE